MATKRAADKPLSREQRQFLKERIEKLRRSANYHIYDGEEPPKVVDARVIVAAWEEKQDKQRRKEVRVVEAEVKRLMELLHFGSASEALEAVKQAEEKYSKEPN